jgi:HKD family nuclease
MFQPNKNSDRLDYGNLLMPPEGFQFDKAIATTYSLDLDALISIPVALYFTHSLDVNVKQDIVQILDSIRRANESVRVFCQKGQIKVPDNLQRLYSFIEPCIIQVAPTKEKSFHPKIWLIRYKNKAADFRYRVIVLSRNLTFDRSWDVAFQLDGECTVSRKNNLNKSKPLIDFVKYLSSYDDIPWLNTFVRDLKKTEFRITTNEFESFTFLPSGFQGYKNNILFGKVYDELLIISPFITNEGLSQAKKHSINHRFLFSREFELKKIKPEILKQFSVYHLITDLIEGEDKLEVDAQENINTQLQDLHAKVYSYKIGNDAFLLLGSSNLSRRAMENNIEFMIRLDGKNSKIGPRTIHKELINDELKIFQDYSSEEEISEYEKAINEQEQELQNLKIDLVNEIINGRAIKQEDSNYRIEFDFNLKNIVCNPKIDAAAYLFGAHNQKFNLKIGKMNNWSISNILEEDISCFLIIDLVLHSTRMSFAMKVPIENLPESRNTKIFKNIISNSDNFFKYVRFLLSENYWEEHLSFTNGNASNHTSGVFYLSQETPIYENMLKAISREPDKVNELKKSCTN